MDKLKNFKEFYDSQLVEGLDKVEAKRKGIINQIIALFVGSTVLLSVGVYLLVVKLESQEYIIYFSPLLLLVGVVVYVLFESLKRSSKYYNAFKYLVINKIIQYINPSLNYDNKYHVSKTEYLNSLMFPKDAVVVEGDDHVSGKAGEIKIEFSELLAKFKKKNKKSETGSDYQFRGIFFVAHCPKTFPVSFAIEPKKSSNPEGAEALGMPEFDAVFQIRITGYASIDSVKRSLSPELVKNLVEFNELFVNDVRVSMVENKFYVAISHDKDLFEPRLFSSNKEFDFISTHFNDLYYPIELINIVTRSFQSKQD